MLTSKNKVFKYNNSFILPVDGINLMNELYVRVAVLGQEILYVRLSMVQQNH
jgi:hypothetical protein